jgi:HK97 family phage prohead protease
MMPRVKEREYRALSFPLMPAADGTQKRLDSNFYVEGYATTFNRYLLYEFGGITYYEEIAPDALDGADMSDVIMQYDHSGKVLARLRNGTLGIEADEKGLFMFADLSKSAAAKELYEEIAAGLIDRMSWAFTIAESSFERLDDVTRLFVIKRIKKVYDVSAVSIPANDGTEISARSLAERSFLQEQQERLGRQARLLKLKIKLEV